MPRNEDGEFELMLGNKQLLSVFFLVVILLGVFFTLGYVVGRSSGPLGTVETATAKRPSEAPSKPSVVVESAPPETKPSAMEATGSKPTAALPVEAEPAPQEKPKPTPIAPKPVEPPPSRNAPGTTVVGEPPTGATFVQVAAVGRSEGELVAEAIAKRGFSARLAPVPDKPLFRVLVGPYKDPASVAKAKTELSAMGFTNAVVRKY